MKTRTMLIDIVAVLAFSLAATAQETAHKTTGVYLTAGDYEAGRLSFESNSQSKGHKLEIHDVRNKPYIDVTHDAEKRRYAKNELFGYRAKDGRDYRFVGNLEYRIAEAKELYIYIHDVSIPQGRTHRTVHEYYFSVGAKGAVQALTLPNLKQAFPDNHRFHDLLDATCGSDRGLMEYDTFHKMYKVNRLLIASRES